jgi:hypothetical protein
MSHVGMIQQENALTTEGVLVLKRMTGLDPVTCALIPRCSSF